MLQLPHFLKRNRRTAPQGCAIYIHGNLYMRRGSDLICMTPDQRSSSICGPDHVAGNGVPVQQIAYAIALIEGMISVGAIPQAGVGLN